MPGMRKTAFPWTPEKRVLLLEGLVSTLGITVTEDQAAQIAGYVGGDCESATIHNFLRNAKSALKKNGALPLVASAKAPVQKQMPTKRRRTKAREEASSSDDNEDEGDVGSYHKPGAKRPRTLRTRTGVQSSEGPNIKPDLDGEMPALSSAQDSSRSRLGFTDDAGVMSTHRSSIPDLPVPDYSTVNDPHGGLDGSDERSSSEESLWSEDRYGST